MKIKTSRLFKVIAISLCLLLAIEQTGFAQVAGQIDIAGRISAFRNSITLEKFRPLHLRYLQYDPQANNFKLLLDKGNSKTLSDSFVENSTQALLKYFLIGVTLPNNAFWVNLRPDSQDDIIDPALAQTDIGKILLETDVQLKKDTASFTSPNTPEGKEYWDKLYAKAAELYGTQEVTIPTLTRPWIVPSEIIIRETEDNAFIYKATLKVMLEDDYLKNSSAYNFKDERQRELNRYASGVLREKIIPKLTREVNTSKRYAALRQVYYSLILAQWFKKKFNSKPGAYYNLIDKRDLNGLVSREPWSKTTYFRQYQKSFKDGEYNFKTPVSTSSGQAIRSYFSGGVAFMGPELSSATYVVETAGALSRALEGSPNLIGVRVSGDKFRVAIIPSGPTEPAGQGFTRGEEFLEQARAYLKANLSPVWGDVYRIAPGTAAYEIFIQFFINELAQLPFNNEAGDSIPMRPDARQVVEKLRLFIEKRHKEFLATGKWNNDVSEIKSIFEPGSGEVFKNQIHPRHNIRGIGYSLDLWARYPSYAPDKILLERRLVTQGPHRLFSDATISINPATGELEIKVEDRQEEIPHPDTGIPMQQPALTQETSSGTRGELVHEMASSTQGIPEAYKKGFARRTGESAGEYAQRLFNSKYEVAVKIVDTIEQLQAEARRVGFTGEVGRAFGYNNNGRAEVYVISGYENDADLMTHEVTEALGRQNIGGVARAGAETGEISRNEDPGFRFKGVAKIGGEKSKEFWVDKTGNLWIFKINPYAKESYRPLGASIYYQFKQRFFAGKSEARPASLERNGVLRQGTLEKVLFTGELSAIDKYILESGDEAAVNALFRERALPNLKKQLEEEKVSIAKLTPKQQATVLQEMVIDWLFSQHDSHPANFIIDANGNIVGIDKEQVFKYFPNDRLDLSYLPNGATFTPLSYLVLSRLALNGQLSISLLEETMKKIEAIPDNELASLIRPLAEAYVLQHPESFSGIGAAEKFIEQFLARKHNLRQDFTKFFNKINEQFNKSMLNILKESPSSEYLKLPTALSGKFISETIIKENVLAYFNIGSPSSVSPVNPVFNKQAALNQQLAEMYGVSVELIQRIRLAGDDREEIASIVEEYFGELATRAGPQERVRLEKKKNSLLKEIANPSVKTKKMQIILRLLASWVDMLKRQKRDFHRMYLARDGGFFYLIDEVLGRLETQRPEYDGGSSVYHLSRDRMSGEDTQRIYKTMANLIKRAASKVKDNDVGALYRAVREEFKKQYTTDRQFRKMVDDVREELLELGYSEKAKLLIVDTGFLGTIPFFVKNVLDLNKSEDELVDETGQEVVQIAIIEPSNIGRFAQALLGFDLNMFSPQERRLIKQLVKSFSYNRGKDIGGHLEGIPDHPISFDTDSWEIQETSPEDKLGTFFEKITGIRMAIACFEQSEVLGGMPEQARDALNSFLLNKDIVSVINNHDYFIIPKEDKVSATNPDDLIRFNKIFELKADQKTIEYKIGPEWILPVLFTLSPYPQALVYIITTMPFLSFLLPVWRMLQALGNFFVNAWAKLFPAQNGEYYFDAITLNPRQLQVLRYEKGIKIYLFGNKDFLTLPQVARLTVLSGRDFAQKHPQVKLQIPENSYVIFNQDRPEENMLLLPGQRVVLGRSMQSDTIFNFNDTVSRMHLSIEADSDGKLIFTDQGSLNGTTLIPILSSPAAIPVSFASAWAQASSFDLGLTAEQKNVLEDPAMGPDFHAPEVRLISQETMGKLGWDKPVLRQGNQVLVVKSYWDSLADETNPTVLNQGKESKLNLLMHEAMADWCERRGVPAEDIPMLLEGLLRGSAGKLIRDSDRDNQKAHEGVDIDRSLKGGKTVNSAENAHVRSLKALTGNSYVTEHSKKRMVALSRAGKRLEKFMQKFLNNKNIKIAIVPFGSTLRGYAAADSDIECGIIILKGGNSYNNSDRAVIEGELTRLLRNEGYEDIDLPLNVFNLETALRTKPSIDSASAYLIHEIFLPVAWGDQAAVEGARRDTMSFMLSQDRVKWAEVQDAYKRSISLTTLPIKQLRKDKPHLEAWLANQGMDISSGTGKRKEIEAWWDAKTALPDFEQMRAIYPGEKRALVDNAGVIKPSVGDEVRHPEFGSGRVVGFEGEGEQEFILIRFAGESYDKKFFYDQIINSLESVNHVPLKTPSFGLARPIETPRLAILLNENKRDELSNIVMYALAETIKKTAQAKSKGKSDWMSDFSNPNNIRDNWYSSEQNELLSDIVTMLMKDKDFVQRVDSIWKVAADIYTSIEEINSRGNTPAIFRIETAVYDRVQIIINLLRSIGTDRYDAYKNYYTAENSRADDTAAMNKMLEDIELIHQNVRDCLSILLREEQKQAGQASSSLAEPAKAETFKAAPGKFTAFIIALGSFTANLASAAEDLGLGAQAQSNPAIVIIIAALFVIPLVVWAILQWFKRSDFGPLTLAGKFGIFHGVEYDDNGTTARLSQVLIKDPASFGIRLEDNIIRSASVATEGDTVLTAAQGLIFAPEPQSVLFVSEKDAATPAGAVSRAELDMIAGQGTLLNTSDKNVVSRALAEMMNKRANMRAQGQALGWNELLVQNPWVVGVFVTDDFKSPVPSLVKQHKAIVAKLLKFAKINGLPIVRIRADGSMYYATKNKLHNAVFIPASSAGQAASQLQDKEQVERVGVAIRSMTNHGSVEMDILPQLRTSFQLLQLIGSRNQKYRALFTQYYERIYNQRKDLETLITLGGQESRENEISADIARRYIGQMQDSLRILRSQAEELRVMKLDDANAQELLKLALDGLNTAINILENRIDIALGVKAGEQSVLAEAVKTASSETQQLKVPIIITFEGSQDVRVQGNRLAIVNALTNVMKNAVSHAKPGTNILVSVVQAEEGRVSVKIVNECDKQKEIAPENLEIIEAQSARQRLFELNNSTREGGTGLGTTDAWYAILDAGGSIFAQSENGKTTFTIILQVASLAGNQDVREEKVSRLFSEARRLLDNKSTAASELEKMHDALQVLIDNSTRKQDIREAGNLIQEISVATRRTVVIQKDTFEGRTDSVVRLLISLKIKDILDLDLRSGKPIVVDIGVGALPLTTRKLAGALRGINPNITVIGTELPSAAPRAHITSNALLNNFRGKVAEIIHETRGIEVTQADITDIRLVVDRNGKVIEAIAGIGRPVSTDYVTFAVAPFVSYEDADGNVEIDLFRQEDVFEHMILFLGRERINRAIESGESQKENNLPDVLIEVDPVGKMLRESGAEFISADVDELGKIPVIKERGITVLTLNNVVQHWLPNHRENFMQNIAPRILKEGGILEIMERGEIYIYRLENGKLIKHQELTDLIDTRRALAGYIFARLTEKYSPEELKRIRGQADEHNVTQIIYNLDISDEQLAVQVQRIFERAISGYSLLERSQEKMPILPAEIVSRPPKKIWPSSGGLTLEVSQNHTSGIVSPDDEERYVKNFKAGLDVCLAVAAYNTKDGRRLLAHILPTGYLNIEFGSSKDKYLNNLLPAELSGPEWRVAIISHRNIRIDRQVTLMDIDRFLGDRNIPESSITIEPMNIDYALASQGEFLKQVLFDANGNLSTDFIKMEVEGGLPQNKVIAQGIRINLSKPQAEGIADSNAATLVNPPVSAGKGQGIEFIADPLARELAVEINAALGGRSFAKEFPGGEVQAEGATYNVEIDTSKDGRYARVVRVGPLIFVVLDFDKPNASALAIAREINRLKKDKLKPCALYPKYRANVIFVTPTYYQANSLSPISGYTIPVIAAMLANRDSLRDAVVFDFGAGDGLLALLALHLGARKVVLIENDRSSIERAKILIGNDELGQNAQNSGGVVIIPRSLTEKGEELPNLLRAQEIDGLPTIALINIGPHYDTDTDKPNIAAVELAVKLKTGLVINGGHFNSLDSGQDADGRKFDYRSPEDVRDELSATEAKNLLWQAGFSSVNRIPAYHAVDVTLVAKRGSLRAAGPGAEQKKTGGIDFRNLPIMVEPVNIQAAAKTAIKGGIIQGGVFLPDAKLDKKWKDIQAMLDGGIIPSVERIKEYLALSCKSADCQARVDQVLNGIADIFRIEEDNSSETDIALKQLLILLESDKPVGDLEVSLGKIRVLSKEPMLIN